MPVPLLKAAYAAGVWVGRALLQVQPYPHLPIVLLPLARQKYLYGLSDYTPTFPASCAVGDLCLLYFV